MASKCSIIPLPLSIFPRRLRRLDPRAFGSCRRSKILDPPLAAATVLAAAPTSAPSLGRQLEAAPATVTSAAAPAVAWAGSQPRGPWSPWSRPGSHSNLFFSLAWQKISLAFSLARSDFCATGNRQKLC